MYKKLFLCFIFAIAGVMLSAQNDLFVSTTGNDSNTGTSWENAKATLAGALAAASGTTRIHLRVGSYSCQNVVIPNRVTVTGGYSSSSTGTDTTQHLYVGENANWSNTSLCTILSGDNTSRVATVNSGGKLEHCVVQDGKVTDFGGGVLINGGTVMHCSIINNVALDYDNQTAKGGGVYIQNNGYLLNCVVAKNHANNGPGVAGTDGTLINNTITANVAVANCGTVTDEDGNVYSTIMIGSQCWMAENLRVTHTPNGPLIPTGSSYSEPRRQDPGNVATCGFLYNWPAVLNGEDASDANPSGVRGICPIGWHVPSINEWQQLIDFVSEQIPYCCVNNGTNTIAKALASTTGWPSSTNMCAVGNNPSTNNATGFNAKYSQSNECSFASCSALNGSAAEIYYTLLQSYSSFFDVRRTNLASSWFVRCVRD